MSFVLSLKQEEPPVSCTRTVSRGGRKCRVNASVCRANCLESILRGRGPQISDGRPALKTTRSHSRAHKLQQEPPPPLTFSCKEWEGRLYIHMLPCPLIKEGNYSQIFACRKWEEGCGGNFKLPSPTTEVWRSSLARVCMFLLQYIIGEGVCIFPGWTLPENITHSHITSTCLLCCITGSKEKRPSPKIKKLYD